MLLHWRGGGRIRGFIAAAVVLITAQMAGAETPLMEDEAMVVTGSRFATVDPESLQVPVQIITEEDIQAKGAITFAQAMEGVQGVELVNSPDLNASPGLTTLRLRGMDVNHVLILVDGKRMAGSRPVRNGTSYTDIGSISLDAIQRIEVLRDGASAQYGADAVAGVINIITKKYVDTLSVNSHAGISGEGDSYEESVDVTGGFPLTENIHCNVSGFSKKKDHFNRTKSPQWGSPDYRQKGGSLGLSWDISDFHMVDFRLRHAESDARLKKNEGIFRNNTKTEVTRSLDWSGWVAGWEFEAGAALTDQKVGQTWSEDASYDGGLDWQVGQYNIKASHEVTRWLSFFVGASTNTDRVESVQRKFDEKRTRHAGFAEITVKPLKGLSLHLSGRHEDYSDFGEHTSPKIALRYIGPWGVIFRCSAGESYQVPTLFQLHDRFLDAMGWNDVYGNKDLKPAEGKSITAGVVWKPKWPMNPSFSVDGFQNRITNMIDSKILKEKTVTPMGVSTRPDIAPTENAISSYQNLPGETRFTGVEVQGSLKLPWNFHFTATGSWLDTEDPHGVDLQNRPRSSASATLGYGTPKNRFWCNVRGNYRGKYISGLNERVSPFTTMNTQFNVRVGKSTVVYLGGRNILDEKPPVDASKYETGHMEGMLDSSEGAFIYGGIRQTF